MVLNVVKLGRCDYETALNIQLDLVQKRQSGEIGDTLILVEHPPVLTLGKRPSDGLILVSKEALAEHGIDVFQTQRGGLITYHGDGQIVGYPIVDIKRSGIGIRRFVNGLEQIFIKLLKEEYGIDAGKDEEHTGVWVGGSKITAIGLAVRRGVTMHGFAFNVNPNMNHFNLIVPCGIQGRGVASLQTLMGEEQKVDFEHVNGQVLDYFTKEFEYTEVVEMAYDIEAMRTKTQDEGQ